MKANKCEDFEAIFSHLIDHIKSSYDIVTVSQKFICSHSDVELVSEALILLNDWPHLSLGSVPEDYAKSDQKSDHHRSKGNEYFVKKSLQNALAEYNTSIMYALHPPVTEDDMLPTHRYRSLALAYANRSAALYELNFFQLALLDIQRCLDFHHPNKLKIIIRKIKCLVHLSLESLTSADTSTNETKRIVIENKMLSIMKDTMLQYIDITFSDSETTELTTNIMSIVMSYTDGSRSWSNAAVLEKHCIPKYCCSQQPLLESEHSSIRGLSSSAVVQHSQHSGRCIVATKDIYPGNIQ